MDVVGGEENALFAGWFHYHKAAPKQAWFQDVEAYYLRFWERLSLLESSTSILPTIWGGFEFIPSDTFFPVKLFFNQPHFGFPHSIRFTNGPYPSMSNHLHSPHAAITFTRRTPLCLRREGFHRPIKGGQGQGFAGEGDEGEEQKKGVGVVWNDGETMMKKKQHHPNLITFKNPLLLLH
ncbi:hypothetical protein L6452_00286 [Arctium lappa]|uniref:Uncharacterized protein n=1 Tax=Arctium lappa TaxID=4217 RepID=A0ACB9FEA5_ARCLA|nr:hypothetical protein L6452_00286 [Arctium lappa]